MEFWYLGGLGQRPFDTFRYVGPWGLVFEEFRFFGPWDLNIRFFEPWDLDFGILLFGVWGFGI